MTEKLDITKAEMRDAQEFMEVHEFKLRGMIEALRTEGIITKETAEIMLSHFNDVVCYGSRWYWKLHKIAPDE